MDVMSYVMGTSQINPNVLQTVLDEEIKRKSGAKIDDLRFDLDAEIVTENSKKYIKFTNMEQIKKVLDYDMDITIIYRRVSCGNTHTNYSTYLRCKDLLVFSGLNGTTTYPIMGSQDVSSLYIVFEDDTHLVPVSAKTEITSELVDIISLYATI